jgi:hypothetical protein
MPCPPTYDAHKNIRWFKTRWCVLRRCGFRRPQGNGIGITKAAHIPAPAACSPTYHTCCSASRVSDLLNQQPAARPQPGLRSLDCAGSTVCALLVLSCVACGLLPGSISICICIAVYRGTSQTSQIASTKHRQQCSTASAQCAYHLSMEAVEGGGGGDRRSVNLSPKALRRAFMRALDFPCVSR